MPTTKLTQDLIKEMFNYKDGNLYWKVSRGGGKTDNLAGGINDADDYRRIGIDGKRYLAHRLIFLYHNGCLPDFLDHIDRDPVNNNINNLRVSTKSQNGMNREKIKSMNSNPTSSKYKGVSWFKRDEKWESNITIDGKKKYLGMFDSESAAAKAYNDAAIDTFGEFAKINCITEEENADLIRGIEN